MFQDLDCYLKCVTIDEFCIWLNFAEILSFVMVGIGSLSTFFK